MKEIKLGDRVRYTGCLVNGGGVGRVVGFESEYLINVIPEDGDGLAEARKLRQREGRTESYYRLSPGNITHIFPRNVVEAMFE